MPKYPHASTGLRASVNTEKLSLIAIGCSAGEARLGLEIMILVGTAGSRGESDRPPSAL